MKNIISSQCFLEHMFGNQLQKSKLQNVTFRFLTYSIDNKFKCTMVIIKHIIDQLIQFEGLWMDDFFYKFSWQLVWFFVYLFTTFQYIFSSPYNYITTIKKLMVQFSFRLTKEGYQEPNNVNKGFGFGSNYGIIIKYS